MEGPEWLFGPLAKLDCKPEFALGSSLGEGFCPTLFSVGDIGG
ncbi:hypothetical protein [Shouchella clausii]|nr:hypothetical protein [Shouchella clausii]